jgi:hypothetical protein
MSVSNSCSIHVSFSSLTVDEYYHSKQRLEVAELARGATDRIWNNNFVDHDFPLLLGEVWTNLAP